MPLREFVWISNKESQPLSGRPAGVCMRKRQKWTIFSVVEVCRGIFWCLRKRGNPLTCAFKIVMILKPAFSPAETSTIELFVHFDPLFHVNRSGRTPKPNVLTTLPLFSMQNKDQLAKNQTFGALCSKVILVHRSHSFN